MIRFKPLSVAIASNGQSGTLRKYLVAHTLIRYKFAEWLDLCIGSHDRLKPDKCLQNVVRWRE